MKKTTSGFTIVELLIVIVVIAILAAISVVAYNGIQNRTNDTAVQNDLRSISKLMELAAVDANGSYARPSANPDLRVTKTAYDTSTTNNLFVCVNDAKTQYAISGKSKSGQWYKVVNGTLSTSSSALLAAPLCALIGQNTVLSSNYLRGWTTGDPGDWAGWTN